MKRRGRSRSDPLNYYESPKLRRALVVNLISATEKSVWSASISSRIPTVILVVIDHQINYNWYNELSAVSQYKTCSYLDMHGLILEQSIWLLAGSTRYLSIADSFSSIPRARPNQNHQLQSLVWSLGEPKQSDKSTWVLYDQESTQR